MSNLFKRGFGAIQSEVTKTQKEYEANKKTLRRFFISANGDKEAEILFLTTEPLSFEEHYVMHLPIKNVICTGDDCPICKDTSLDSRATLKGAFLIYDTRKYEITNQRGETEERESGIRIYAPGITLIQQIEALRERNLKRDRGDLDSYLVEVIRSGRDRNTSYSLMVGDPVEIESETIMEMLPEPLREFYDGTKESLYTVLSQALNNEIEATKGFAEEDEEIEEVASTIVGVEDVEDDEPTKRSSPFKRK